MSETHDACIGRGDSNVSEHDGVSGGRGYWDDMMLMETHQ
jgi:hypothetical protein